MTKDRNVEPGRTGGGESGGGGYKDVDVQDGDNRTRDRPVKTGRKPDDGDER